MPWSLYTYSAFINDFKTWKNNSFSIKTSGNAYCYAAILLPGLIISISSQQAPHYLLPCTPFIALVTSRLINKVAFTDLYPGTLKLMLIFRTVMVIILWPLVFLMITYFFPTGNFWIWSVILFLFFLLVYSYFRLRTKIQKLMIPLLITILAIGFTSNTVYMPSAMKYFGPIQASYLYNKLSNDNSKLYTYKYDQFETYFYPENVSELIGKDQLKSVISKGSCWFITNQLGYEEINSSYKSGIEEEHVFPYKRLTNLSLKFLNPKTREKELSKVYLLKIR
jgi:hypothetical protein